MPAFFFWLAAIFSIVMAVLVITVKNPVRAVVALVGNFIALGVLFLLLHGPFMAVVEVLVYAGAIMVLFLFVVTLLMSGTSPPEEGRKFNLPLQIPMAVLFSLVFLAAMAFLFSHGQYFKAAAQVSGGFGSISTFGLALFRQYLLPFELTALVLLVAVIGVVVLGREKR